MDELMEVFFFVQENKEKIMAWDDASFGSLICMLMEERCRKTGENVVTYAEWIAEIVKAVNADEGKYGEKK